MKKTVGVFLTVIAITAIVSINGLAQKRTSRPAASKPKPVVTDKRDTLEMVFVLDTTGSMGGLIEGAKQRIWGIINEVMQKPSKPRVKVGLVAYRDNGDAL